jgi:Flp pilus assembly protein TadG
MSLMVRHLRGRKGQALAEFALILPILFLLIAGIIEFGRGWNIKQALTDAAREGARWTVVDDGGTPQSDTPIITKIKARLALASIVTTSPTTTITVTPVSKIKACKITGSGATGAEMTVLITTQYRMGWVGAILKWAGGSNTITISSKATMRNEC